MTTNTTQAELEDETKNFNLVIFSLKSWEREAIYSYIHSAVTQARIDELERQPWFDADQQTYIKNRISELEKGTE